MIGEQILGYRVTEVVGAGSYGTVYKVSKTNASGTYVRALKHIKIPATKQQYNSVLNSMGGDYSKADDYFAAALRETVDEIRILSLLSESGVANIVRYYENDIIETEHPKTYNIYMMMEYLTPFPKIVESRTMSVGEVIRVGKDILKALISCHQKNIIHRDIKDDNIFVTRDGVYKLGDFGVSKKLQDKSRAASMRGTPNFIAPEVYLGKESYDCTVDLYSLGIVLYRLLNKFRGPFLPVFPDSYTSDDENAAFEARMSGKTPALPLMAQNRLGEVVCKAIMPRKQRYNSAREFLEALEQAESELSREDWLAPAYDVFSSDDDSNVPGRTSNTSLSDADKTIGGLSFDPEVDEQIRIGQNLFMTIGADQNMQTPKVEPDQVLSVGKTQENKFATKTNQTRGAKNAGSPTGKKDKTPKDKRPEKTTMEAPNKPTKRTAVIAAVCAAVVLGLVLMLVGAPMEIGGKEVEKDTSYVYLEKITVTAEDVAKLAKLKDLRYLKLTDCTLSNDAMSHMKDLSETLREVEIRSCSGLTDYSHLTAIKSLTTLVLDNVQLTDAQLANMLQNVPANLAIVELPNNPSLTDLSALASVTTLEQLIVSNTAVREFSRLQNCKELRHIRAQNCGITELSSLSGLTALTLLDLGNNQITGLAGLENLTSLEFLYLNNNKITSLDPLRQSLRLKLLDVSDNQITNLQPLAGHAELSKVYASRNALTSLEGLEQAISLKLLIAAENQIAHIDGLVNCAVLETVDLSYNQIQDITLLGKSAGTMKKLYFHQNNVTDISALAGMTNLKYLGFDYNRVTSLAALEQMKALEVLSASHNEIESLEGLSGGNALRYIYLDHNKIQDMSPILYLSEGADHDVEFLDLSQNQITEVVMSASRKYRNISVYGNPIVSFRADAIGTGHTMYLPYVEGEDYSALKDRFNYFVMADCPLDQQYNMNKLLLGVDYLSPYLKFEAADALDQSLYESKTQSALAATE